MSNFFGASPNSRDQRTMPQGDVVARYASYTDAQKAVDFLADQHFAVQFVSIIGNDAKVVERVTGRLSYPKVALMGAAAGAWFGLFVGVMLSLFSPPSGGGFMSVPTSMLLGAGFWMLFGIVSYAAQRGKRDFTSTSQMIAASYDILVAWEVAPQARRLLHGLSVEAGYQGGQQPFPGGPVGPTAPGQGPAQGPGGHGAAGPGVPPQGASGRQQGWPPYSQPVAPGSPVAAQPVAGASPTVASNSRYPDLPDGRPQYGVRIDGPAPAASSQQPTTVTQPVAAPAVSPAESERRVPQEGVPEEAGASDKS